MLRRCWAPEMAFLRKHSSSCTPSRSSIPRIPHALARRSPRRSSSLRCRPSSTARSTTPTCCCRSRRSLKRRASSSIARAGPKRSTPWCQRSSSARPAWKVLRVLGSMLGLADFGYDSIEAVRRELPSQDEITARLSNATKIALDARVAAPNDGNVSGSQTERVADVPIYFADPLVRRAPSLQKTRDARAPLARVNAATLAALKLTDGGAARVRQAGARRC